MGVGTRRVSACGQWICVVSSVVMVTRTNPCVGMPMTGDSDRVGGRWWSSQLVISAYICSVSKDNKAVSLGTGVCRDYHIPCYHIPLPMCHACVNINEVCGSGVVKIYQGGEVVPGVRVVEQGAYCNRTGSRVIQSFRFCVMGARGGFG